MNLGLRVFAFIHGRDVIIESIWRLNHRRYECGVCPSGSGGIYVNTSSKIQECFCVGCGQQYLVKIRERP